MARRKVTFDVEVNTPSATREADRVAKIFEGKLKSLQVGTKAGSAGGGGGGGGGGGSGGMPGSSLTNLIFGSAQYAIAGGFYKFFSDLPSNIVKIDALATANKRAAASFATLAGGTQAANDMIDAYVRGSGGVASRTEATTEAMRLFNIGMADNAQQMQAFVTLSRGMSQALGKPVEYVQEQFSLALANQSQLRFDQLGLSIERHQQLMAELSQKYPELTREVIFQNAMLQQASEKYLQLATSTEALATGAELAAKHMHDLGDAMSASFQREISSPFMADFAQLLGATEPNLKNPRLELQKQGAKLALNERVRRGGPTWTEIGDATAFSNNGRAAAQADYEKQVQSYHEQIAAIDAVTHANDVMTAAMIKGVDVPQALADKLKLLNDEIHSGTGPMGEYAAQASLVTTAVDGLRGSSDGMTDALMRTSSAADVAAASIEALGGRLEGAGVAMVGKLMGAGFSAEQTRGLVPSQDEIDSLTQTLVKQHAMEGDIIDDEIAAQEAEKTLYGTAQAAYDTAMEAARAGKGAASALEKAATKQEKAIAAAADKIKSTFSEMLHKIPGLYGTSDVTEEDLKLAGKGIPVNYADDALRRLEDVAFNKTKRDDVNLDDWAQALRLPAGTDPEVLAIFARRAWQSGELFANPQNIDKFVNMQAAKGDLLGQEQAALGTQNLDARFGIGTKEGNEFLRVFGMKALDPVQDGLISEITTRGPIMGQTLADAMYDGFESQAMSLPWVERLMQVVTSQIGRELTSEQNNNAKSDLAESESVGYEYHVYLPQ